MRLDRKLLLIAPTIVLACVIAGVCYAAMQLHVLGSVSDTLTERSELVGQLVRGEKTMDARRSAGLLQLALEVEAKRTTAIRATRDLLIVLASIAVVACAVLAIGIRSVPREHWPRMSFRREPPPT